MVAINTSELAADGYRWGVGALQWPGRALLAAFNDAPLPHLRPAALWMDPSDALTAPAIAVPLAIAWRAPDSPAG
jgi:hypothetical protein